MAASQQLLDMRGRPLIERRGATSSLKTDAYHFLRTTSWTRLLLLFAGLFVVVNLVFALVLYVGGAHIDHADGFLDYCWFSVQTMATIGYGYYSPTDHFANAIVTVEAFVSIIITALITGIFFARFSTPSARVIFSNKMIIAEHDGRRVLQFRMANDRATAIVEATVRLYLVRDERLADGTGMRRVYDLPLRRGTTPVFALSFLVVHAIDDASPLAKVTTVGLRETNANFIVTFTGIDDGLAATVHARHLWTWNDVVFDQRFVDLFRNDATGKRYLDLGPIHDTEDLPSSPLT
jgi:inward rectifier potassium channel